MTWSAVTEAGNGTAMAETIATSAIENDPIVGLKERDVQLVAPDLDHLDDTLATPLPMTDAHYAELYEPEGYLDNTAELGPMANRIHLESDLTAPPRYDVFVVRSPMLIASAGPEAFARTVSGPPCGKSPDRLCTIAAVALPAGRA